MMARQAEGRPEPHHHGPEGDGARLFPDGTIGRFRTNRKQVYAERLDEHDPSQPIGESFKVTPKVSPDCSVRRQGF